MVGDSLASVTSLSNEENPVESGSSASKSFLSVPGAYIVDEERLAYYELKPCFPKKAGNHQPQATGPENGIEKPGPRYWSTTQEDPHEFKTFDGFRRHENEREKYYVLLPDGLIEDPRCEPQCALCLHPEPDDTHFKTHNILNHAQSPRRITKKSRKGDFEKLLRTYNVPDGHVERLVKRWHCTQKKKAYSCGLCIKLMSTLLERTKHLAHDHYERGQDRAYWNVNNLIKGLLLQKEINQEYRRRFSIDPSDEHSRLIWEPSIARDLQERLELGKEAPGELAQAAFESATRSEGILRDQDILATGSQFAGGTFPSMNASLPSTTLHATAIPTFRPMNPIGSTTSTARHIDAGWEPGPYNESTETFPFQSTSHMNEVPSYEADPLAVTPSELEQSASHFSEGTLGGEIMLEGFMQPASQRGVMADEEHLTYMPYSCTTSALADQPMASSSSDDHWSQEAPPWSMEGQMANARHIVDTIPATNTGLKRKVFTNTAASSQSRSQTISPTERRFRPKYKPRNC